MKNWIKARQEELFQNPVALILFILLLSAVHAYYVDSRDLKILCELTGEHNGSYGHPLSAEQKIDNICLSHRPDDGYDF